MDFYDELVVAGEGDFVFTRTLLELANHVGIPPPESHGKTEYREMGLEKWTILTKIPGRVGVATDEEMSYIQVYPEWHNSVEIAMQGAIARICYKYHSSISRDHPFSMFGERMENGRPVYRGNYYRTLPQRYFAEREVSSARTEAMMSTLVAIMDHLKDEVVKGNETLEQMEHTILALDDRRQQALAANNVMVGEKCKLETQVEKLEERIKLMEDPLKMEAKLIENENWISILQGSIPQMGDTFTQTLDEKNSLAKENVELENEVEALKKKMGEATIEVEPAERFMILTEEIYAPSEE